MSNTLIFVEAGKPVRRFKVSPRTGTEAPVIVDVEDRLPFTRKIQRHVEKIRERGDGTKIIEYPIESMDYTYDFTPEMKADAVRGYNIAKSTRTHVSDITTKNLVIEDLGPVMPENMPAERPQSARSRKQETASV